MEEAPTKILITICLKTYRKIKKIKKKEPKIVWIDLMKIGLKKSSIFKLESTEQEKIEPPSF